MQIEYCDIIDVIICCINKPLYGFTFYLSIVCPSLSVLSVSMNFSDFPVSLPRLIKPTFQKYIWFGERELWILLLSKGEILIAIKKMGKNPIFTNLPLQSSLNQFQ